MKAEKSTSRYQETRNGRKKFVLSENVWIKLNAEWLLENIIRHAFLGPEINKSFLLQSMTKSFLTPQITCHMTILKRVSQKDTTINIWEKKENITEGGNNTIWKQAYAMPKNFSSKGNMQKISKDLQKYVLGTAHYAKRTLNSRVQNNSKDSSYCMQIWRQKDKSFLTLKRIITFSTIKRKSCYLFRLQGKLL